MRVLPLDAFPAIFTTELGDGVYALSTLYNYTIRAWTLDIHDANGEAVLLGLMLYPHIDLLRGFPTERARLGGLVLLEEHSEAHRAAPSLGTSAKLLWFAADEDMSEALA